MDTKRTKSKPTLGTLQSNIQVSKADSVLQWRPPLELRLDIPTGGGSTRTLVLLPCLSDYSRLCPTIDSAQVKSMKDLNKGTLMGDIVAGCEADTITTKQNSKLQ